MSDPKYGSFEDLLEITAEELRPIASKLKEIIGSIDSNTCEIVRLGDRTATYGVGPKKMSEGYAYIMPQKKWVNLGFYKGATLKDDASLLEGTGKQLRHIKIRSLEEAEQSEVQELLVAAIEERKTALNK